MFRSPLFCVFLALAATGLAAEEGTKEKIKEGAKTTGKAVGHGAKQVGHGFKEGAKDVGHGARKVGRGFKKGGKTVGHGVKDAVKQD
jgi:hypothetical protein